MESHSKSLLVIISLILVFLVKSSDQKQKAYYFSNVNINFNPKYGNLTADLSPWNNNTKTNRNLEVGKISMWTNKDFTNILGYYEMKGFQIPNLIVSDFQKTNDPNQNIISVKSKIGKLMENLIKISFDTEIVEIDN
ncbi:unnamed protein product [Diamesa serratosioi]